MIRFFEIAYLILIVILAFILLRIQIQYWRLIDKIQNHKNVSAVNFGMLNLKPNDIDDLRTKHSYEVNFEGATRIRNDLIIGAIKSVLLFPFYQIYLALKMIAAKKA